MEAEGWQKIKAVFDSVVLADKDQRSACLSEACAGDSELRDEVEVLLSSFDAAEGFMEKPFAGEIANMLASNDAGELQAGDLFNRYKVVRKIGAGGIGK